MTSYKCEAAADYPLSTKTNCDVIKCYHCDATNEIKEFFDWIDNQTKIKTLQCKQCSKRTCVKVFVHAVMIKNEHGHLSSETKYFIYTAADSKTRQGRGPPCRGQNCNQPTYTKVIDQDRFLNKEIITCQHCGIINEITATSPSLRDAPKAKIVGEWLTKNRLEQIRQEKISENAAKFDRTHNPKRTRWQNKQIQKQQTTTPIETSNIFSGLLTEDDGTSPDPPISTQIEELDECASTTSTNSKRKAPASPELITNSAKRSRDNLESKIPPMTSSNPDVNVLTRPQGNNKRVKRLPPVICTNETWLDSASTFKEISKLAQKHNCDLKFDRNSGRLLFTPKTVENRDALIEELSKKPDFEYHTYGTKLERRPAKKVIAKGVISTGYVEQEIIEDIETRYGLKPERAVPLKNAAMILIFNGDCDMRDIKSISTILCQKVKIEKYKVKLTAVTQCKRCLQFGHVQAHCGKKPRSETETEKDSDGNIIVICSNCHEPGHTARQAKCPQFKEEIQKQRERRLRFVKESEQRSKHQDSTLKQQSKQYRTITPGITFSKVTATRRDETVQPDTDTPAGSGPGNTQRDSTSKILDKIFSMFQTMQKQMMQQMEQMMMLIRNDV